MADPIIEATQPRAKGDAPPAGGATTWSATDQWAIVEVFGHRRLVGIVQEVEQFGSKMMRIDPIDPYSGKKQPTQYYGGGSIFSLTLTTKEAVDAEIARYSRPALPYRGPSADDDSDDDAPGKAEVCETCKYQSNLTCTRRGTPVLLDDTCDQFETIF